MILSNRPGLRRAASRMSGLLVAPMILTSERGSKPSISANSCISVLCTSRSPLVAISSLLAPMASSSSINSMEGALSLPSSKSSRTRRAPSPMYFWTSSEPTRRMKVALVLLETAFAKRVLPVPGSPTSRTPFGGSMPTFLKSSGFSRGSSTASRTSRMASSKPPTSS